MWVHFFVPSVHREGGDGETTTCVCTQHIDTSTHRRSNTFFDMVDQDAKEGDEIVESQLTQVGCENMFERNSSTHGANMFAPLGLFSSNCEQNKPSQVSYSKGDHWIPFNSRGSKGSIIVDRHGR